METFSLLFSPLGQRIARQLSGIGGLVFLEKTLFQERVENSFLSSNQYSFCTAIVDSAVAKRASVVLKKRARRIYL